MERLDEANINTLSDGRTATDSQSAIDMDLVNGEGTEALGMKLSMVRRRKQEATVARGTVMKVTTKVGASIVLVNQDLAPLTEQIEISKDWNGEEHVTMKDNRSRGKVAGRMNRSAKGTSDRADAIVKERIGFIKGMRRMGGKQGSKLVTDGLVGPFTDGVARVNFQQAASAPVGHLPGFLHKTADSCLQHHQSVCRESKSQSDCLSCQ